MLGIAFLIAAVGFLLMSLGWLIAAIKLAQYVDWRTMYNRRRE